MNNHIVLPFAPMSKWLCILILACATAAHAAPQGTNSDDMDRLLADKGLLTRLEDVSHKVAEELSDRLTLSDLDAVNQCFLAAYAAKRKHEIKNPAGYIVSSLDKVLRKK